MHRVSPGDEFHFPAHVYNGLIGLLDKSPNTTGGPLASQSDRTRCLIRNDTGDALPRFGVVGIGDPLILPAASETGHYARFAFKGMLPTAATYEFKWGLTLHPIADDAFGIIQVSGLCYCYVTMTPSSTPDFAKPNGTVAALAEADCGARVLWRASGTGAQRAIVIL